MEYLWIFFIVIAIVIGIYMLLKRKKHIRINEDIITVKSEGSVSNVIEEEGKIIIKLEQLPVESIKDESRLMQITDNKVLARIHDFVPELFQVGNTVRNTVQAIQTKGQVLYQAIIPSGAKLADSKDMAGAVRGIYHGTAGVKGHANLVAVQQNTNLVANVTASAMGVASMVVGQYYMTQIEAELGKINDGITKVMDFQDNEYKSKVLALMTQIQKIAKFQADILGNDELRLSEIENLNRLENECIQLLGQANLTIAGYAKKKVLDYEAYEKGLAEINKWFVYQKTLIEIVVKMAEIKHILYCGKISKEQCCALLDIYSKLFQSLLPTA